MPETRGRKPKYEDPDALRVKVNQYFDKCAEDKVFPDMAGLRIFLKLTRKQINYLCEKEETGDAYREIFEEAADRRESMLIRTMVTQPKQAAGCLNALKQKENGGYTDKPQENKEQTLNIRIMGGHGEELFK